MGITSPLHGEKNVLTSESYSSSEMPRTLVWMKAIPSNAVFCKKLITMGIAMIFRCFSSSSLTVCKAPNILPGIIVALTSHNFCTPVTAMSMILYSLFSLLMTTISGL